MKENQKTPAKDTKPAAAKPAAPAKVQSFNISHSDETLHLATDLANFIKENKLTTQVQGKDFVNVEGWQYAGSRLGIVPIVEHVLNVSTDTEIKYQAKVTLFDMKSGHTVGAGFAVCSNKEQGKKFYQEFAIMSMAQTRAIGKAYRNILAWIIRAAGYEPTPAEEMEYGGNQPDAGTKAEVVADKPQPAAAAEPAAAEVVPATAAQKEGIIRLLNHPKITKQEKTKGLLDIDKLDTGQAERFTNKLNKMIDERPEPTTSPGKPAPKQQASKTPTASETVTAKNAADEAAGVKYLSKPQMELIIVLLNNPVVSESDKTKMLLNVNRLPWDRANVAIDKLINTIEKAKGTLPGNLAELQEAIATEAEQDVESLAVMVANGPERDAAAQELREFVEANEDRLGRPEADRLFTICDNMSYTAEQLLEEKRLGVEWLAEEAAA